MQQQVFISYRNENSEHARAVRRLSELLRQARIPVALDQFYLEEHPAGPDMGWPKWCEDCANESSCVLIIASEGWFAAYDKAGSPNAGLGAAGEADLFRQTLWDEKGYNDRIRLVFLHDVDADKVPKRLQPWQQFRPLNDEPQMDLLIKWISQRLGLLEIEAPKVRWPQPLHFASSLADRKKEWPSIVELLAGRSKERIVFIQGASGLGKSALLEEASDYAGKLDIPSVRVNFKGGGMDVEAILGQFDLDMSSQLPNFSREGAKKTHLLRKDLRYLRQAVLVIFDGYEDAADNKTVVDWLTQLFLPEVETAFGLTVIVAGQKVPDWNKASWRDLVCYLPLEPITEIEDWEPWVKRRYPAFLEKGAHLRTVLLGARGNPMLISSFCEAISKS
jgi:hypothetical protein